MKFDIGIILDSEPQKIEAQVTSRVSHGIKMAFKQISENRPKSVEQAKTQIDSIMEQCTLFAFQ